MDKFDKRKYNQSYYQKRKEKGLAFGQETPTKIQSKGIENNIFPILAKKPKQKKRIPAEDRKKSIFESIFLTLLVSAMTYYLIRESALFFQATEGSLAEGYLKALIIEGIKQEI